MISQAVMPADLREGVHGGKYGLVTKSWGGLKVTAPGQDTCLLQGLSRDQIPKVLYENQNLMFLEKLSGVWEAIMYLKLRLKSVASLNSIDLPSGVCLPLGFLPQFRLQLV